MLRLVTGVKASDMVRVNNFVNLVSCFPFLNIKIGSVSFRFFHFYLKLVNKSHLAFQNSLKVKMIKRFKLEIHVGTHLTKIN